MNTLVKLRDPARRVLVATKPAPPEISENGKAKPIDLSELDLRAQHTASRVERGGVLPESAAHLPTTGVESSGRVASGEVCVIDEVTKLKSELQSPAL